MIPFIIFILSVVSAIIGIIIHNNISYASVWDDFAGFLFMGGLLFGFFSFLIFPQYAESYKLYPVEYSVTKSNTYVAVATNYGVFKSNKIEDLNEWSKNKTGYIKVKYNVLGIECQEHEFVTNNTKE